MDLSYVTLTHNLRCAGHLPHTDDVIGVTGEQSLTISRPGQGDTLGQLRFLTNGEEFRAKLVNNSLGFQIPDLDGRTRGSAEPVAVRAESHGIDDITSFQSVQVLSLRQVPQHGDTVLATRGTERTIRGDGDGVKVSGMTDVVGHKLAADQVPDLNQFIPTNRNNDRVLGVRREANGGNPFLVTIVHNGKLALTKSIPQLIIRNKTQRDIRIYFDTDEYYSVQRQLTLMLLSRPAETI